MLSGLGTNASTSTRLSRFLQPGKMCPSLAIGKARSDLLPKDVTNLLLPQVILFLCQITTLLHFVAVVAALLGSAIVEPKQHKSLVSC